MANSLQHISDKMMKMDIDKVGAASLGLSLIPAVPDKFLIKYNPPKIWVVYHFKDHSEKDQFWRDIPLELNPTSTASSVTNFLFKEHSYYFDSSLIGQEQVIKLIGMILQKNGKVSKPEEAKNPLSSGLDSGFGAPKGNRLFDDIQKARDLDSGIGGPMAKKGPLEPLKNPPKGKLEPLESKPKKTDNDEFDLLDLDGFGEPEKKETKEKKDEKIEDDYAFDFEFESNEPDGGSKVPPKEEEQKDQSNPSINMEKFEKEKEKNNAKPK